MFMHGIEEFDIVRGDTLANPGLLEDDALKRFNVILANPPYSIKSWDSGPLCQRPVWPQSVGDAAAGLCRLCLSAAHSHKP